MARPRSIEAHQLALGAALNLFAKHGIDRTSMDAISEESGVSKATLYKHWANKEALLLDVVARAAGIGDRPEFNSGHTRADLIAVLTYQPRRAKTWQRIVPHLVAYSAHNPKLGQAWKAMVMDPPRRELTHIFKRAIASKELSSDFNPDAAIALLLGSLLYVKIFSPPHGRLPRNFVESIVETFWRAFAQESPGPRREDLAPKVTRTILSR